MPKNTINYQGYQIEFFNGTGKHKYKAVVYKNGKKIKTSNFGKRGYQQYRDSTPLKLYSADDHMDEVRRKDYETRQKGILTSDGTPAYKVKFSPAWFSLYFLWK